MSVESLAGRFHLDLRRSGVREALIAYVKKQLPTLEHQRYLFLDSRELCQVFDPISRLPAGEKPYVNLDYAATKPRMLQAQDLATYLDAYWDSSHGRSTGVKSGIISELLASARTKICLFFGFDYSRDVVVFVPNTSAGMNKLIKLAARDPKHLFLISEMSHHSTQLPARLHGNSEYFKLRDDGTYDLDHLETLLSQRQSINNLYLVIESQSNVTGYKNDVDAICKLANRYHATVFIDHAQGASSMPIKLVDLPGRVFVVVSGHKLYARGGSGAIVGPKDFFEGKPDDPAGGTVSGVSSEEVSFLPPPANQEPGTQNAIAQISLAKALAVLKDVRLEEIAARERALTKRLMSRINEIDWVEIIGEPDLDKVERGPVISFRLVSSYMGQYIPSAFVGLAFAHFFNVGTRNGFFCAHPYFYRLNKFSPDQANMHANRHAAMDIPGCAFLPGDKDLFATRLSFGFPTSEEDLARVPAMLEEIRRAYSVRSTLIRRPDSVIALKGIDPEAGLPSLSLSQNGPYWDD